MQQVKLENRDSLRSRVLKTGTIAFNGAGISCTVRNLSTKGANLEVDSPFGIPDLFTLALVSDHTKRQCRVVWRRQKRIGVVFEH